MSHIQVDQVDISESFYERHGKIANRPDIISKEKDFHDKVAQRIEITDELVKLYCEFDSPEPYLTRSVPRLKTDLAAVLSGHIKGQRVLVYGCGNDSAPLWFARQGAIVDAIDISPDSIKNQKTIARTAGYQINALARDAHRTDLSSNHYDLVYGNAILHHLDLTLAVREIFRVLKPGGIGVFRDVMKGNFFLQTFRRLTPFWRTPDEHPLTRDDLRLLTEIFPSMRTNHYYWSALPYGFFLRMTNNLILRHLGIRIPPIKNLYAVCDKMDSVLFKCFPFLKNYAWICLITLTKC